MPRFVAMEHKLKLTLKLRPSQDPDGENAGPESSSEVSLESCTESSPESPSEKTSDSSIKTSSESSTELSSEWEDFIARRLSLHNDTVDDLLNLTQELKLQTASSSSSDPVGSPVNCPTPILSINMRQGLVPKTGRSNTIEKLGHVDVDDVENEVFDLTKDLELELESPPPRDPMAGVGYWESPGSSPTPGSDRELAVHLGLEEEARARLDAKDNGNKTCWSTSTQTTSFDPQPKAKKNEHSTYNKSLHFGGRRKFTKF